MLTPRSPRGEDGYNKVDVVTHDPAKPTKDEKKKKDKGKSAPAALAPLVSPSGEPLPAPAEATPVPTGYVVACRERAIEVGLQVSASFNNLDECKTGGGGVEIHELTTAYISKQCEESHLLEMVECVPLLLLPGVHPRDSFSHGRGGAKYQPPSLSVPLLFFSWTWWTPKPGPWTRQLMTRCSRPTRHSSSS